TFARTELMIVSGRQVLRDKDKNAHPAVVWLLDQMARGLAAYYQRMRVVTIRDGELLKSLGLKPRPNNRYQVSEVAEKAPAVLEVADRLSALPGRRSARENAVIDLAAQIHRLGQRRQVAEKIHEGLARRQVDQAQVFWIDDEAVLGMLGLPKRDIPRYSED